MRWQESWGKTEGRAEERRCERDESVAVPTSQCWSVNGAAHPSLHGVSSLSCSMCTHSPLQATAQYVKDMQTWAQYSESSGVTACVY